jgi:hypothetical protein
MRAQAISPRHIADKFNDERIPIPSDYEAMRTGKPNPRMTNHFWSGDKVKQILNNPTYLGDLVQLRTTTLSYKNKKVVKRNKDEWIIVSNTHEPIITREIWNKCREIEASVSRGKMTKYQETKALSGIMFCGTCGNKMRLNSNNTTNGSKKKPRIHYRHNYTCGSYSRSGKIACSSHYIKITEIDEIVLDNIREKANLVVKNEKLARQQFLKSKAEISDKQAEQCRKELFKCEKRFIELDNLIQKVYEDKIIGKIPGEVCIKLLEKYQVEQTDLSERITELKTILEQQYQGEHDVDEFIRRIKQYATVDVLDRTMVLELIDNITIGTRDAEEREIHIYYKLLGEF